LLLFKLKLNNSGFFLLFFFLKRKEVVGAVYFLFGGGYRVQKKEGFLRNSFLAKKTRISVV